MTLLKKLTDAELVMAYQNDSDTHVFGELYNRYNRKIFLYVQKILKNREDALDVTQEIFIKISKSLHDIKEAQAFIKWLFLVARNAAIDYAVKKNRTKTSSLENVEEPEDEEFDMYSALLKEDQYCNMQAAMSQLQREDKAILTDKYFNDKSVKELMTDYGMSSSAIKMRLMRSRQKLNLLTF
ncbi:MAG: RNA polymerase sigma factor (sigma-70 family) [Saprospiraceae bacterium]|jgi:RNA polymerase sigma factor (sigma-70 family)